jgi:signal transduction histidine kinase
VALVVDSTLHGDGGDRSGGGRRGGGAGHSQPSPSAPRALDRGRPGPAGLAAVALAVFSTTPGRAWWLLAFPYTTFPFLLWAAIRLGLRGAALANLVLAVVAATETLAGSGPFSNPAYTRTEHLLQMQAFLAIVSSMSLVLAALARDLRAAEDQLRGALATERKAAERLRELDRLKDDFLSTVSHELRTPLTAIKGLAEVLRGDRDLDSDARDDLNEKVCRNASEMAAMIEQLLDYSRLQAGEVPLDPAPLAVKEATLRCVVLAEADLRGHPTALDVPSELEVEADRRGFERIMVNLLTNAAKYSAAEAPIRVTATRENGNVVLSVDDEGVGIPPAEHGRVFERFYQGSMVSGRRGTGIGLSIVRRYVELQGGRIWVRSEPGSGSSFRFTLPLCSRGRKESNGS